MRAMKQDELRHTLFGLLPPPAATVAPVIEPAPTIIPPAAPILSAVDASLTAPIDNAGGQPTTRNVPATEMKLEDIENYMIEKAKRESLELV